MSRQKKGVKKRLDDRNLRTGSFKGSGRIFAYRQKEGTDQSMDSCRMEPGTSCGRMQAGKI